MCECTCPYTLISTYEIRQINNKEIAFYILSASKVSFGSDRSRHAKQAWASYNLTLLFNIFPVLIRFNTKNKVI